MRLIDAEKFEVFDATCQITKGIRSGKTAAYFYGDGCRKVLEAIDAAPTIDPESLRPTAHWIKRVRMFRLPPNRVENKRKPYEVLHVLRRKDGEHR